MISQYDCDLSEATFKAKVCSSLYALFPMLMQRRSASRPPRTNDWTSERFRAVVLRVANARVGPGSTQYGGQAGLQTRVESIVDSNTHETELNTRSRQRAKGTRRDQLTKLLSLCCQTNSNSSQLGQGGCPSGHAESAPFGESGASVLLEDGS